MRKTGLIGKKLAKVPKKPPPKKASENVGPLGFKTHQRPEDAPRKV